MHYSDHCLTLRKIFYYRKEGFAWTAAIRLPVRMYIRCEVVEEGGTLEQVGINGQKEGVAETLLRAKMDSICSEKLEKE